MTAPASLSTLLIAGLLLAGCAAPERVSRATAAQQAACRQRADEAFARANPNDQYRADLYVSSQRDSPFGGTMASDPTADLQARFSRGQMVDTCLRRVNAQPSAPQ
ncbi:MAG: hypothetical protein NT133_03570 [Alphaproteobacteria bacterium]|nr:hypothetical protein [Alphaproteobacteria bacterium]